MTTEAGSEAITEKLTAQFTLKCTKAQMSNYRSAFGWKWHFTESIRNILDKEANRINKRKKVETKTS